MSATCGSRGAATASNATHASSTACRHVPRAPDVRTALLRAFVRARFGDDVDTPPSFAHRIARGAPVRYDPGVPLPEADDDPAVGDSSDIRSIAWM